MKSNIFEKSGVANWAGIAFSWLNCIFLRIVKFLKSIPELITAIATVGIFIVAGLQWATLEKTLLIGQRAFVHLESINFFVVDKWSADNQCCVFNLPRNEGKVARATFSFTNSGNTPTKLLRMIVQCQPLGVGQKIEDPFNLLIWEEQKIIWRSIRAKQTIIVSPDSCDFTQNDALLNAQMRMVRRFLIGEVKYEDWVEPGNIHVTRFVHELVVNDLGKEDLSGLNLTTIPIGRHNCTDDDCPK